jgi:hypothetical protein
LSALLFLLHISHVSLLSRTIPLPRPRTTSLHICSSSRSRTQWPTGWRKQPSVTISLSKGAGTAGILGRVQSKGRHRQSWMTQDEHPTLSVHSVVGVQSSTLTRPVGLAFESFQYNRDDCPGWMQVFVGFWTWFSKTKQECQAAIKDGRHISQFQIQHGVRVHLDSICQPLGMCFVIDVAQASL